jgi:hypothetical protein
MFEWLNKQLGTNMGWGDVLGAGLGLAGSYLQYQGQQNAADQLAQQYGVSADELRKLSQQQYEAQKPLIDARNQSLSQYAPLLGLGTAEQNQAAISGIQSGAGYKTALNEALKAADTSATVPGGLGLRSSNQAVARASIAPQLLQSEIDRKIAGLGGLIGMGQSAANVASQGALSTGSQLAGLFQQQGQNLAGLGGAQSELIGSTLGGLGGFLGMGGYSGLKQYAQNKSITR